MPPGLFIYLCLANPASEDSLAASQVHRASDFGSLLKITQTLTTVSVFVRHQHKEGVPFSIKAIRQLESGDTS
jgi:hypothetical protein